MNFDIYIRPLKKEDAIISYKWRNDPKVWKYTGNKPTHEITYETEQKWLENKLSLDEEIRYAICLVKENEYIGNVQLTNIRNKTAEFHIFIGEKKYWGKGIGKKATEKMLKIGFETLGLNFIYLEVDKNNLAALKAYKSNGFVPFKVTNTKIHMKITNNE